jgi:hypothetical protein
MGPLAHLVERLTCTEEAAGSNPAGSTQLSWVPERSSNKKLLKEFFVLGEAQLRR